MENIDQHPARKSEGFLSQKLIVLPRPILDMMAQHPLIKQLYPTDIGYFPRAANHYRTRENGCEHSIVLFCVDGRGTVTIDEKSFGLAKNQLILIPAHLSHLYQADHADPWSLYWLHFHGTMSSNLMKWAMKKKNVITIDPIRHGQLLDQFNQIYALVESGYSIDSLILASGLLRVFLSVIGQPEPTGEYVRTTKQPPFPACLEFMRSHLDQFITLDDLAQHTHWSKSYMTHQFRLETGFSPIDYFIHIKMQKACILLDTTNLSVKEISTQLGYQDPLYFSRVYKRSIGMSATDYRNIKKG